MRGKVGRHPNIRALAGHWLKAVGPPPPPRNSRIIAMKVRGLEPLSVITAPAPAPHCSLFQGFGDDPGVECGKTGSLTAGGLSTTGIGAALGPEASAAKTNNLIENRQKM